MIRGVIFDMDGTLFDTERLYTIAWKQVGSFFHCCCRFQQNIFSNILIIYVYIIIFCLFCTILYVF